jgi:hypothetical protein
MTKLSVAVLVSVVVLSSCSKSSSPTDSNTTNSTISGDVYFQGTINGAALTMTPQQSNFADYFTGEMDGNWVDEGHQFSYQDTYGKRLAKTPMLTIHFIRQYSDYPGVMGYDSLVYKGSMPYTTRRPEGDHGVVVEYSDANGHTWASDLGAGAQDGSSFVVVSHDTLPPNLFTNDHFKTKASFACMLYDSVGASMKVTEGKFGDYTVNY